jgi:hypothetical protein
VTTSRPPMGSPSALVRGRPVECVRRHNFRQSPSLSSRHVVATTSVVHLSYATLARYHRGSPRLPGGYRPGTGCLRVDGDAGGAGIRIGEGDGPLGAGAAGGQPARRAVYAQGPPRVPAGRGARACARGRRGAGSHSQGHEHAAQVRAASWVAVSGGASPVAHGGTIIGESQEPAGIEVGGRDRRRVGSARDVGRQAGASVLAGHVAVSRDLAERRTRRVGER